MKKRFTLFALTLCSFQAFAQWNYTGTAFYGTIRGLYFMNADTGFAVGSNGSIAKTQDGGVNWDLQAPGIGLMRGVQFIDDDTGYVCGQYGQVFKSTDGGLNWFEAYNDGSTYFRDVEFVNAATGFLAGPSGKVYKSTNYGASWTSHSLGITDADVINIEMINEMAGYLVCANGSYEHGYIYKTSDGGESWQQIYQSDTLGMLSLTALNEDTVYAAGNLQTILRTTDGGANWDTLYSGSLPEAVFRGAFARSSSSIVFVDDFGNVIATQDYGSNWTSELVGNSGLFCIYFPNATIGFTGDFDGSIYSALFSCVLPGNPGDISGSTVVCSGTEASFNIHSIAGADTYAWTAPPGASVIAGQGDTSVVILFGGNSGTVSVTGVSLGCGSGPASSLEVTVNAAPEAGAINGAIAACEGSQETYATSSIDGVSSYEWSVPEGASILSGQGDTAITVLFGAISGEVRVTPSGNDCGEGMPSVVAVTVTPLPLTDAITGNASVCEGSTGNFSTAEVLNADSYEWTVPGDAVIMTGQGTASIEVQFGTIAGDVTVTAVSSVCGSGPTVSFPVTLDFLPGTPVQIFGNAEWCSGDTAAFSINSVDYGDNYTWSVPNSCEIISSQGDTAITVVMATGSGDITVYASNSCGNGGEAMLTIDVHPTPTPTITQSNDSLFSSSPQGNQWYYNGNLIPGATDQIYVATQNGTYYAVVTSSFGCSAVSNSLEVVGVGIPLVSTDSFFEIYPNPSNEITFIHLSSVVLGRIIISNQEGQEISEDEISTDKIRMDVSDFAKGIYLVKLIADDETVLGLKKLVVQ